MSPAGRPKEFDEEEALERALDLFWRKGYKGSSLADLLAAMQISRQSLYDTFGNKRGLFLRVIHHYRASQLSHALALLEREGSPVENVKDVVRFFEQLGRDPQCRGCLVANSLVELGPTEDEEITTLLHETLALLKQGIEHALEAAQATGELGAGKSPRRLALSLTNSVLGMAVTGRLRVGQDDLSEVYAGTLDMLD